MNELLSQIMSYVPALWRRRWLMLSITWLVCLVGWAIVSVLPDKFESQARVFVDTDSLLQPLLAGIAVETNTVRQIDVMQRTLVSRPNLEKVARMTDLDLSAKSTADTERMINDLRDNLTVRSERSNLFSIVFEDSDPQMAQKVVQSLLTIFVESNLGSSRKEMDAARQFIDEQVRIYEEQMDQAEQRLAAFKQANIGMLPGDTTYYAALNRERDELAALQAEMAEITARKAELSRQLAEVPEFLEVDTSAQMMGGPPSGIAMRVLELETRIDELLLRYTDKHPDVVAARARLEELRKLYQQEMSGGPGPGPGGEPMEGGGATDQVPNEVHQNIKMQIVEQEANIATLRTRIGRRSEEVVKLEEMANRVPEVEAELARLTRDYGVIKKNYEELLARKEAAIISESRETKGEKVQFRIIEPPQVPVIPSGVKRSAYLSIVLVAGVAAGIAIGWLIAGVQTTFFSTLRLAQITAVPILGSVTAVAAPGKRSWRSVRLAAFAVACLGLLGTYGSLMTLERNVGLPNMVPQDVKDKLIESLPPLLSERLK